MSKILSIWVVIFAVMNWSHWISVTRAQAASQPSMHDKCDKLLSDWKDRLATEKLTVIIAPPYVIAGDGSRERLESYRDRIILGSANALHAMYFKVEPSEPILMLLFESDKPYTRLSKDWLNEENPPHFGYCRRDGIMVMNMATGGGTLVHELTHALIAPDFPTVPSWFNEGLASLYEQSSNDGKTIRGEVNWRLHRQKAIQSKTLRPLKELMQDPDFYGEKLRGINYAQARYIMFYLQEKKLLQTYYTTFRDGAKDDPTGLESFKQTIGPQTMDDFETKWKAWVMTLRFQ